ncbi:stimulator of interferon genes protein isoform X2 [Rhinatrema bivittatum]|nr:stimulator of interferon genes protein isoform X2 [Rhinatrema bivittatum]
MEGIPNVQSKDIIPKMRGCRDQYAVICAIILCFAISCVAGSTAYKSILVYFLLNCTGSLLVGFVKGLCDFFEESHHVQSRYQGQYSKAACACISVNQFLLLLCGCFLFLWTDMNSWTKLPIHVNIALVCSSQLLMIAVGLQHPTIVEISKICEKQKLNVAHGLAWSYFLGYLKLVLPNLEKAVCLFNKDNDNLLGTETCKLYILIPLSCRIHSNLSDVDSNIQFLKDLPALHIDRAGIKSRAYKNNIYSILDEDQRPYYCIVEYATPLLTLYEMSGITNAGFSSEDRLQQAKLFYRTLKEILESSLDCQNSYRLVVYEDCATSEDEAQNMDFLSLEILKHIRQQQRDGYSSEKNIAHTSLSIDSAEPELMLLF